MITRILFILFILNTSILAYSKAEFITDPAILQLVKIEGIKAGGTGCHIDEKGEPVDFKIHLEGLGRSFHIGFDRFDISGEDEIKTKNCILTIIASYPQGTALYVYEPKVSGLSELEGGDSATLETFLKLPNYIYPKSRVIKIDPSEEKWESERTEYQGDQKAPCGGDFYKIQFEMKLTLHGSNSYVSVSNSQGVIDPNKIKFELKKCK